MKLRRDCIEKVSVVFTAVLTCVLLVTSCQKNDEGNNGPKDDVNTWIYKTMQEHYLWYGEMPSQKRLDYNLSPEDFFNSLLVDEDGAILNNTKIWFSTIEKKDEATKAISDASDSYGFEYASLRLTSGLYYAWVLYVLPNSPAAEAGLKRGDWIVGVNNISPIMDLSILNSGIGTRFQMAQFKDNKFVESGTIDISASRTVEDTPFLKDSVYHVDGKTIGYLLYNHFASGPDNKNYSYDERMKQIFVSFKSENVNEFVLDLRYNGGGLVTSSLLLTSLLAPANALGKTFCIMEYNDKHADDTQTLPLKNNNELSNANLNLKRIYVLVGDLTASASEAVINCLIPYMGRDNITLIGQKTIGKRVGSVPYGDNEDYGWILHPITFNIFNADHNADYGNGFNPDVNLNEMDYRNNVLYPLGDRNDLLLGAAINLITGHTSKSPSVQTCGTSDFSYPSLERKAKGLIYTPEK